MNLEINEIKYSNNRKDKNKVDSSNLESICQTIKATEQLNDILCLT